MRRRPGVTLIEVLVAIFIMAIGMLALLALFPLGAISMAQALKDDRCSSLAGNAEAVAVAQDIRRDVAVTGGTWGAPGPTQLTFNNAFVNPWNVQTANLTQVPGYAGPSFGVIVDPHMYPQDPLHAVGPFAGPPATSATTGLPRCSLVLSANYGPANLPAHPGTLSTYECARWCSMLDGVTFVRGDNAGANGVPDVTQGSVVRDGRYTVAWLLRRPQASSDSVTQMSVIIYSNRPTSAGTGVTGEVTCSAAGVVGTTTVVLTYPGNRPALRNGGWVLDTTPVQVGAIPNPAGPPIPINVVLGTPYRVVNVTDSGANQLTLELQTPLPAQLPAWATNAGQPYNVQAITVLEYAVEIIDRGSFVQP
jgi:prepilin-type N-terminal cleavage/methylation domain-containing protein